jgi:hypothetical protein
MAMKFATYSLELQVVPNCRIPRIIIDDANMRFVWRIPRPICTTNMQVDANIVKDSVNAYLATLPDLGSNGDVSALGTIIAVVPTYDDLPTLDQLQKPLTDTDLAIVLGDGETTYAGIYKYNTDNSMWEQVPLALGGGTASEGTTDEEVEDALGPESTDNTIAITYGSA